MGKLKAFFEDHFVLYTSILSGIICLLYVWKGFVEDFTIRSLLIIGFNFLYIPFVFIFKRKIFSIYYLIYAFVLIFVVAFTKTYLYNNYSALFIVSIIIMLNPKLEIPALIVYFVGVCIAFAVNEETLCHFLIHIVRSIWFIGIMIYVLGNRFERKKLILFNDEKQILDQLLDGKHYQKEVEGFSENTIYRKLKAARERNGNVTREELIEMYRKDKEMNKED